MKDLIVNIYLDPISSVLEEALTGLAFPSGISGEIHLLRDSLPDDAGDAVIFITDRVGSIRELPNVKPEKHFIVFCGEYLTAAPFLVKLDDLWPLTVSTTAAELRTRCGWLLNRVLLALSSNVESDVYIDTNASESFSHFSKELTVLAEYLPYPLAMLSNTDTAVVMNSRFRDIVLQTEGFSLSKWKQQYLIPCSDPKYDPRHRTISREYILEASGKSYYYAVTESDICDQEGNIAGTFCTISDNTYQRTYEKTILKAANTDVLTGMYNRRYFYNFLNENITRPFYLLYIDIDHFKAINDNFGHDVGDEVLIRTTQLINKFFPDSVSARIGGDEFAVFNDSCSHAELKQRGAELEKTAERDFKMYRHDIGLSIGMVFSDGKAENIDLLLREGDARMYEVKKTHHNQSESNDR